MLKRFTKVPVQAMNLSESSEFKFACTDDGQGGKKKRSMSMTGYSGGVIKNHWWWEISPLIFLECLFQSPFLFFVITPLP